MRKSIGIMLCAFTALGFIGCTNTTPMMLDLSSHYNEKFPEPNLGRLNDASINGIRTFDELPFMVRGRAYLYGQYDAMGKDESKFRKQRPNLLGIPVGRKFEELHLLHTTRWPDIEGGTIAQVRLNYADGTNDSLDIGYGVHVRDWQRLYTEASEALSDQNSKVVWRGPGQERFRSEERMFKSMLLNPHPKKLVESLDVISAENLATYSLSAITVVNSDPDRSLSAPAPQVRPEHKFDGRVVVRVLDDQGEPIHNAWISTGINVPGSTWHTVVAPQRTSAKGFAFVKYPTEWTTNIWMTARKEGWKRDGTKLNLDSPHGWKPGTIVTLTLSPITEED